jgi:hypothetical protein
MFEIGHVSVTNAVKRGQEQLSVTQVLVFMCHSQLEIAGGPRKSAWEMS